MSSCLTVLLRQYLPYTFTVALLDLTDPASLLTIHLYMYCPTAMLLLVVYDELLATVVQLLPECLLSQEYTSVPRPLALHMRVMLLPIGTSPSAGCSVMIGRPVAEITKLIVIIRNVLT